VYPGLALRPTTNTIAHKLALVSRSLPEVCNQPLENCIAQPITSWKRFDDSFQLQGSKTDTQDRSPQREHNIKKRAHKKQNEHDSFQIEPLLFKPTKHERKK